MVFDYTDKKSQDVFVNSVSLENVARSEVSDDRAQSVHSIHSEDLETPTLRSTPTGDALPSFDELEQRLERSQRNMLHIQKQREQLLRLTDSFKEQLDFIERSGIEKSSEPESVDDFNFESVEKMNTKISTLTNRLQALSTMIDRQRELESQLNSDDLDIDVNGEQEISDLSKKLASKTTAEENCTKYKASEPIVETEKKFEAQEKQVCHLKESVLQKNDKLESLSKKIDALKNMATMAGNQYKEPAEPRSINIPVKIEKPQNKRSDDIASSTSFGNHSLSQHLTTLGVERKISTEKNNLNVPCMRDLSPQIFSSMETLSTALTNSNKLVFLLSKELETAYATIDALQDRLASSFKASQVPRSPLMGGLESRPYNTFSLPRRIQQDEEEQQQEYREYRSRHEVLNKSYKTNEQSRNNT